MVDSSPSHIISKKTFVDYLQDVAGGSHDNHDGGDDDDDETEGAEAEKLRPPESSDENRSHSQRKRKTPMCGMTSPQLTEARSFVNGLLSPFSPLFEHREQRDEYLEFVSLQPCRKLSVVVRVLPCDDSGQRCLFQHVRTNNLTQKPKSPHDMVVVKPSAFGKVIPSQVTMETARLVAQVAHISSEDWARLYEFHHVMWPDQQQEQHTDLFGTMDSLSQAVAQDALMERQSSLLISMGQARTCVDPTSNGTCLLAKIIKCCQTLMEPKAAAIISMVELQEEKDSFRDLFNKENKQVSLRHVDMKGAVLEGLTQIPLDDFNDTWKTLRHKQKFTIVATISIWDNAVAQQLKRSPDSHITCVELAPSTDPNASHSKVTNTSNTVCLGLALRQLSLHSSMETDPAISYRESNITKVLQRALESSKIVLLASVSQLSEDYEITLATLNFLRSLLVKSGKTASSPFHNKDQPQEEDGVKTFLSDQLQQYAKDESLLEQIIADPRQRLAKVFKQSPAESKQQIFIDAVPSEEYNPVDYMQGLDIDHEAWQSPAPPQQERRASTTLDRQRPVVIEETPKEIWSMEEPLDDLPLSNQSLSGSIASPEDFRIISSFQAHTLINEGQFFEMEQQGDDFSLGLGKNDVSQLDLVLDDQSMGNKEQCIEGDNWSVEKGERDILDLEDEENEDFFFAGDKIQQSQNNITEEHHSMSEEIVFSREEPKTRSHKSKESQSYQRTHDFPGSSDFPDRNVQMLPEFAHHDLSLDDSVVSRGEISSYFEEDMPRGKASLRKGREIHEPLAFLSSPRICSDTNSGPCSGIDSVFSSQKSNTLGDVFGHSGERREYSSKAKQKEVEEAPYIDEIQILEDALYQIQSKQRGVWRASVESLSILKEALSSQFHEIALLSNDREALANTVEALKQGISRNALEQDVRLQSCEEEVQLLQAQLHEAISEKERLDQAVDSNLIEGMTQVKGELAASKREVLVLQDSYNTLLYAHNKLHEEAKAVKSELSDLKGRKEYTDQYCAKLEHSLATIEKDNVIRINEAHVKDAEIQDMADKLDKSEQKQQALQKSVHHLEGLGMMETLEIEQIKFSHKSLSSLLDERRKEIASLVEGRHKDKMRIQHLQIELNKLQESTQVVKESARSELKDLEQRLVFAEDEARTREGIMARLKERCQHLEDEVEKKGSENKRLEEQCTKLRQELEKLEEEIRNLVSGKHLGELKIKQLEDRLQNEESTRLDNNRLREKYTQSEKDRHKLESLLIQCRSEFYDEADRKTRDLVHFENRNMELEQESKIYEQRSKTISAMRDAQIARLQSELDTYIAKLEAINTRSSNAEVQLQSMEVDYATINEKCEKYRKRIINAEQELKSARDKGEKDAIESSVHLENLHRRVKVLENENAIHIQERERMYIRSQQERSDAKRLSFELEKTQGELMTIRRERSRLEQDLEERETERRSQERQLSSMKHLIHKLQSNTKERFQTLSQDSTKLVDCLKEQKERLELKLLKTESERDACTSCLDYGRERLSRFCQRGGSGELLEARFENRGKHEPFGLELYLLDCPIDQIYAVGANINRCPEASTNVLLRGCPDANLNQQSRLHSICEDEKGVVSALLDRIRYLECEIRGTPLGSSHQLD